MKSKILIISLLSTVALSACSAQQTSETKMDDHADHQDTHAIHDIREQTKSIEHGPTFLIDKPEDMQMVYFAAAQHKDLLEKIPCYCGCGDSVDHKNNYDCFIYENKENGTVVWDDHGTKCGVCLEIAAQAIVDYSEGKSIKDIRADIDDKYKEGYATPTPTPEV